MEKQGILNYLYDNRFDGFIQFWGLDGASLNVFLGADRVSGLKDRRAGRHDVYLTKNIMTRPNDRKKSSVFAYNSIVVDLDLHCGYTLQQIESAADVLRGALVDDGALLPSLFVHTGRGVQLWYCLEAVPASLGWLYNIAQNKVFDYVAGIVERCGLPFEIDESVKDSGRVVRLPGSWNHKVQRFGSYEKMNPDKYDLHFIIEEFGGLPVKEKKEKTVRRYKGGGDYAGFNWKKKGFIEWLVNNRESMEGFRNTALYLYADSVFQILEPEAAADAVRALNDRMGLLESEVESVVRYYLRHENKCHARKETLFELLSLTEEEIEHYEQSSSRAAERRAAKERKAERNAEILRLKQNGYNVTQIADALGVSRPTVYAVLGAVQIAEVAAEVVEVAGNGLRLAVSFVRGLVVKAEAIEDPFESVREGFGRGLGMSGAPPGLIPESCDFVLCSSYQ